MLVIHKNSDKKLQPKTLGRSFFLQTTLNSDCYNRKVALGYFMINKVQIEINTTNAAFNFDSANTSKSFEVCAEICRILRGLADKIEQSQELECSLYDINGNKVGQMSVESCNEAETPSLYTQEEFLEYADGDEEFATWLEEVVKCLKRQRPDLGLYDESATTFKECYNAGFTPEKVSEVVIKINKL